MVLSNSNNNTPINGGSSNNNNNSKSNGLNILLKHIGDGGGVEGNGSSGGGVGMIPP